MNWLKRLRPRPAKPSAPAAERLTLSVTDTGFSARLSGPHAPIHVRWQDIHRITLFITDAGPFQGTHFLHIAHAGGDLTLPQGAKHMATFTEHLRTLDGFNAAAFDAGLASEANGHFVTCYTAQ